MKDKLFFQTFLLSVAVGDWVEITKVVDQNRKKLEFPRILTSTPPSYEVILVRPQKFYEISATTPVQENITGNSETLSSSTPFNLVNSTLYSKDVDKENTFYKSKITETDNTTSKETFGNVVYSNQSKIEDYFKERSNNPSSSDDDDDYGDDDIEDDVSKDERNDFSEKDSSRFASVLKHVQKHLLNYKEKSLKGKIELLKDLRDNMLYEIKTRMSKLWLPTTENKHFKARGYKDPDDHYHMDFPSNEGALMTIGFLTFAVFLIKLVLKLIYTLKYKQQYYFQATTTTAASVFLKRNEREITQDQLEQSAKIMQYIEEYPLS